MNYLGSFFLVAIALVSITLLGILVAHWFYRLLYVGREYKGVTIAEDLFILLFTIPSAAGAGYIAVILPIGLSLLISVGFLIWFGEWPKDEPLFSMNNLAISEWPTTGEQWRNWVGLIGLWLGPVLAVSIVRRRKVKHETASDGER